MVVVGCGCPPSTWGRRQRWLPGPAHRGTGGVRRVACPQSCRPGGRARCLVGVARTIAWDPGAAGEAVHAPRVLTVTVGIFRCARRVNGRWCGSRCPPVGGAGPVQPAPSPGGQGVVWAACDSLGVKRLEGGHHGCRPVRRLRFRGAHDRRGRTAHPVRKLYCSLPHPVLGSGASGPRDRPDRVCHQGWHLGSSGPALGQAASPVA